MALPRKGARERHLSRMPGVLFRPTEKQMPRWGYVGKGFIGETPVENGEQGLEKGQGPRAMMQG